MTESDPHPLSRYRVIIGKPSELVAVSLSVLAEIHKANGGRPNPKIRKAIVKALHSEFPLVRRYAFHAWSVVPTIAPDAVIHIVMATEQGNDQIAIDAFIALAQAKTAKMRHRDWLGLLRSSASAAKNSNKDLRWAVARCLTSLGDLSPSKPFAAQIDNILTPLKTDICFSVRRVFHGLNAS